MSEQQEGTPQRIQAVDFNAPDKSAVPKQNFQETDYYSVKTEARWWHSQFNLMLGAFGLLAVTAIVFILVVPEPGVDEIIDQDQTGQAVIDANEKTPWQEVQKTQARSESQTILSKLLNAQEELENQQVQLWAAERFDVALETAKNGDELYKQQQYQQAIADYQTALTEMELLKKLLPRVVEDRLMDGQKAMKEGKSQLAQEIFTGLLQFAEHNEQAKTGLERASKLDEALVYIKSASVYEQDFQQSRQLADLQEAEAQYQKALEVDAKLDQATDGLQRVQAAIVDKRFQIEMSKGFAAMTSSDYRAAKKGFSEALKIKPDEKVAISSYQQALVADQSSSLSRLVADAKEFEKNENWQNALSNYQLVLQRDANQVQAKLGVLRVSARDNLDKQLNGLLQDKLALSQVKVKQQAETTLSEAQAIKQQGPRLKKQITQLSAALDGMKELIKVQFSSDQITQVTLTKSGASKIELGQFLQKNLSLKPGRYIAKGMRLGFRDVRLELELYPGRDGIQEFAIQCNEPINNGQ